MVHVKSISWSAWLRGNFSESTGTKKKLLSLICVNQRILSAKNLRENQTLLFNRLNVSCEIFKYEATILFGKRITTV
jgi:hypothetical protein